MSEPTFEEWQERCADLAKRLLNIDDLLDESDPYELFDSMEDHFDEGSSPQEFIQEVFADDLVDRDIDEELSQLDEEEALEEEALDEEEEEEDDDEEGEDEEDEDYDE